MAILLDVWSLTPEGLPFPCIATNTVGAVVGGMHCTAHQFLLWNKALCVWRYCTFHYNELSFNL